MFSDGKNGFSDMSVLTLIHLNLEVCFSALCDLITVYSGGESFK